MRAFLRAFGFALVIATGPIHASPDDAAEADAEVLRVLKQELWPMAYRQQDTALLDRILADEFQMIDGSGDWSGKKKELDWVARNRPAYDSLEFEICRLDIFENGTAIVAGTGHIRGTDDEGPYVAEYQSTNVLIKREGAWRAIASHVSGYRQTRP
jgi:hypothetical protein